MNLRAWAVVPLVFSAALRAQGPTTGAIEGTILDADRSPLPGVAVEARSPSLQGLRGTATDSHGRFHLPSLPPGVYRITAALDGFERVEEPSVRVALGETAIVPFTMRIALASEVVVGAEAPLLDVTSPAGGENVRDEVIRKLPVGRNYADILRSNPGVATDRADTQGRAIAYTIYGATSLENQYLVDGANTTNVNSGFEGKALPNEFIEEVEIKTTGYEAEYGHALGGIVNVITKSGGNDFHGDVFGYFGARALTARSKAAPETDEYFADRSSEDRRDYGLDLGGPIVRDRLWFFGAYNRVDVDQDQRLVANPGIQTAGQNFPIAYSLNVYAGKLTYRAGEATTFVGTAFGDPERREGALKNFDAKDATAREATRELGGTDVTLSAQHLFGAAAVASARYAHHRDSYVLAPKADIVGLLDFTADPANPLGTGGMGNIYGILSANSSVRDAWKVDGTLFLGAHELKAGAEWEKNRTDAHTFKTGGQFVEKLPCPASGATACPDGETAYYLHDFLTSSRSDPVGGLLRNGTVQSPVTNRLGLFVQDAFRPASSVTIRVGLRYDRDDVRDPDGRSVFTLQNEWQPRVGVAWDVLNDGRSRISASYGRFYYALPTALSVISYGYSVEANTFNFSPTALGQDPAAPQPMQVYGGLYNLPVQGDIKGIYQDEVTFGLERAFDATFSIGVRYTYRNLGRTIATRCDLDPGYPEARDNSCVLINPGSDDPFATGVGIHGCDGRPELGSEGNPPESQCGSPALYPLPAVPAASRRYHGIEVVARKQVKDRLYLQASYVYSRLRGNYDGMASNGFGTLPFEGSRIAISWPGFTQDFNYPALVTNSYGDLYLDRPHAFRLDAAYTAPFGLSVGVQGFLRSGTPISKQEAFGYGEFYYRFLTPRGSEGRTPWAYELSLQLQYPVKLAGVTATLFVQGFDLLNKQTVTDVEGATTLLPDYPNPDYGKSTARLDPRSFRLGARVSF